MRIKEFCLLALLFAFVPGFAQQDTTETGRLRRERASMAIKTLDRGVLVVRLSSESKKIQTLKDIIEEGGSNASRAQRLLEQTIKENREINLKLMESFETYYKFSKVYWLYDTTVSRLNAGEIRGFLLNKSLEADPDIVIESKEWLTAWIDYTNPANTTRVKALIFGDQQWEILAPPFPWALMLYKPGFVINDLVNPHKSLLRNIPRVVKEANKDLIRWHFTVSKRE